MKNVLEECIKETIDRRSRDGVTLNSNNPIKYFYSEFDFSYYFTVELEKYRKSKQFEIFLECPIMYYWGSEKHEHKDYTTDVMIKAYDKIYPIELKYNIENPYLFVEDIWKIEQIVKNINDVKKCEKGYCMVVSDDEKFWNMKKNRPVFNDFDISNSRDIILTGTIKPKDTKDPKRYPERTLLNSYEIKDKWVKRENFGYLIIEVNMPIK